MNYKATYNNAVKAIEELKKSVTREINSKSKLLEGINIPGSLRVTTSSHGKTVYYYNDAEKHKSVYIRKKDIDFAARLAKKDYLEKALPKLKKMYASLVELSKSMGTNDICDMYDKLHPSKRLLLHEQDIDDQLFIDEWLSQPSQHENSYEIMGENYTMKNEHVRSKSEKIIADSLFMHGVPYKYECALILNSGEIVFPDFTALNVRKRKLYYIEHLGMMSDQNYVSKNLQKLDKYQFNGIWPGDNLLLTYESWDRGLNSRLVDNMIERFLL